MTKGFTEDDSILQDPNIFIGDPGATSSTTPHDVEFKNMRDSEKKDDITSLMNIVHMPGSTFNLFSMTKRMQDGWTLVRDKDAMWLTKGDAKLLFDIKIKTPKGALFCTYLKRDTELSAIARKENQGIDSS